MTWAVDYIAENFVSDEETGFIWECVEGSLRKCYTLKHNEEDGESSEWSSEQSSEWSSELSSE